MNWHRRVGRSLLVSGLAIAMGLMATTSGAVGVSSVHANALKPKMGGELTMDWVGLLATPLVPAGAHSAGALFPLLRLVYEGLLQVGPGETIQPDLATKYRYMNNGHTLQLTLRRGVKFQDGTPFNAQAVAYNLANQMNPKFAALCSPLLRTITSVTTPSTLTVDINTSVPDYALPMELAASNCGDMASPAAEASEGASFGITPGPWGSGPFQVTGYTQGTSITYTKSTSYFDKKHVYLSGIQVNGVGAQSVAYAALLNGSTNIASSANLGLPNYKVIRKQSGYTNWNFPAGNFGYIRFDFASAPFTNPLAREAVILATNQKQIVNVIDAGLGTPLYEPLPPDNWAYSKAAAAAYPKYDLAKASSLVQQLGGLSFTIKISSAPATVLLYEALQEQWAAAGIKATISTESSTALENDIHTHNYQVLGNGWGEGQGIDPDAVLTQPFVFGNFADGTFNDPIVISDISQARSTAKTSARKAIYQRALLEINKQMVWDMLPTTNNNYVTTKNVHGLEVIGGISIFSKVWIS